MSAPQTKPAPASAGATFYCVADKRYFLGAVALINSLRLVGHSEPILLLDCGLGDDQAAMLEIEATLLAAPSESPPWLLKAVAPLSRPAETMILLDTDMVATRRLDPLIESAAAGSFVAFENPIDRFVPEWGELLGLGDPRRGPYLSSAAICVGEKLGVEVLGMLSAYQGAVDFELTHWRRNVPDYPFMYADQDILNAILATSVAPDRVLGLEASLSATPPFDGLELREPGSLRCAYADGTEPFLVHHHVVKPWLEPTHEGVYTRLLRRLLLGEDVAIRVPAEQVPSWLRSGPRAFAQRKLVNFRQRRKRAHR